MGVLGKKVFIFGGDSYTSPNPFIPRNDLWQLDTETMAWTELIPNGQPDSPSARNDCGSLVSINSSFGLFGGCDAYGTVFYNDFWRLKFPTARLFDIRVSPNPILSGQPFNLSWATNITEGAPGHVATVLYNGRNFTNTYNTSDGSILLDVNETLANFTIQLSAQDAKDSRVKTSPAIINFTRRN